MESPELKGKDVFHLLPQQLVEDALEMPVPLSPTPKSESMEKPSPQMPPLESRIHKYMLRSSKKQNVKLNLLNLFEKCDIEQEVEKEVCKFGGVSLFNALETTRIFEDAANEIKGFLHNKENIPPSHKEIKKASKCK